MVMGHVRLQLSVEKIVLQNLVMAENYCRVFQVVSRWAKPSRMALVVKRANPTTDVLGWYVERA